MIKLWSNSEIIFWSHNGDNPLYHSAVNLSVEMKEQKDRNHCQWCGQLIIEGICNFCGGPSHGNYTRVGIGIAIIRSIMPYGAFFLTLPELSNFFLTYKHVGRRDVYDDTEIFLRMRDMRVVSRILPDVVIIDPTDQDSVYVDVTLEGQIQVANSYLEEWRNL